MLTLRNSFKKAIGAYRYAFGDIDPSYKYLVRSSSGGVVVLVVFITDTGVYVIKDQVLVKDKKIYRNYELVRDLTKEGS